jgi:AraC-like DNA-binding protein
MKDCFVKDISHFDPHDFSANDGEGLYRSHSHKYAEIVVITDGEGYYTSEKNQNIHVSSGSILIVPPHLFHGFVCVKAWKGMSIHLLPQNIPHYCNYQINQLYKHDANKIIAIKVDQNALRKILHSVHQMEDELSMRKTDKFCYDILRNALELILLLIIRHEKQVDQEISHPNDAESIFREVLQKIHLNFNTSLKVSELSSHYYLSESTFRKKFKEHTGYSPKQYLTNLRLDEAKRLLRQTKKTIEFISTEVGFSSSSRFHDLFTKREGATPFEWRMQDRDHMKK